MKLKYKEAIITFLLIFVMLFNAVGMAYDAFSYDMDDLPTGKLLYREMCLEDEKDFRLYLVEIKGVNTALRGEVSYFNEENKQITRNVYWQVGKRTASAGWKDADTITIDGKDINIYGTPYDSRTQIELPEYSAKNRTINN